MSRRSHTAWLARLTDWLGSALAAPLRPTAARLRRDLPLLPARVRMAEHAQARACPALSLCQSGQSKEYTSVYDPTLTPCHLPDRALSDH